MPPSSIVTLNVGGHVFQTTRQTLSLAGPTSLLADPPPFIDRDPALFSLLLSLLRTNRLPSNCPLPDLIAEAQFYGLDLISPNHHHHQHHFDAFHLAKTHLLPLNGRDLPSAIATDHSGAVHVAHGGKLTSFDWSLSKRSSVLTPFPAVDSLLALDLSSVAAGAVDSPGLQILNLGSGSVKKTLNWNVDNGSGGSAVVQSIGLSPAYLFASFESIRRNSSAIVAFDRTSLRQVVEIGRREVYGAELDSAIPATKLKWVDGGFSLLLAAGSHAGPAGLTGDIRLWDVRSSGKAVWETTEKADCFADVAVSESLSAVFKVGVNSGEVFMRDLRKLGGEKDSWISIGRGVSGNGNSKLGNGCVMECFGDKLFVSRGGDVEMWSEVVMRSGGGGEGERVMRRNLMGGGGAGKKIVKLGFGGRRMVVVRKEEQSVEVWDSSTTQVIC